MFGLWNRYCPRPSESFYRNLFALLTFAAFGVALITKSPIAFFAILLLGALSRTSIKKRWSNPWFAKYVPWLYRKPLEGTGEDEAA